MQFEFDYIDRNKRILSRLIQLVLYALMVFFWLCFWRWGKFGNYEYTIIEKLFDVNSSFRILGWIGLPVSIIIYFLLPKIIKYKGGKVILDYDKIEVTNGNNNYELKIKEIDKLTFIKDMPFEGDTRNNTEKASRIQIYSYNKKYDFELSIKTKEEFENLTPILKHWKENIQNYKVEYTI